MSNEFDDEFDFDDEFVDELADFEDFSDDDPDVLVRTAVLQKNSMIALLCIKSATAGAAICRVDPRENNPAVQLYDDPTAALEWFTKVFAQVARMVGRSSYDGSAAQA
jgi:hypothetical protein